jgi:hypothetical protein
MVIPVDLDQRTIDKVIVHVVMKLIISGPESDSFNLPAMKGFCFTKMGCLRK